MSQDPARMERTLKTAVALAFALLTVVDVGSFRQLWLGWSADSRLVEKTVFEEGQDGAVIARSVPWAYAMLPQPAFQGGNALILPPGYPMMLHTGAAATAAFQLHVYEERAPAMVLLKAAGETAWNALTVDAQGKGSLLPLGVLPPGRAVFDPLLGCLGAQEEVRFFFNQRPDALVATLGHCSWSVPAKTVDVVVDSFDASARVELEAPHAFASRSVRWWVLLVLLLASLIHRAAMRNTAWVGTDAAGTLVAFVASMVSPLWLLLWCLKALLGLGVDAWAVLQRARTDKRLQVGLGVLAAVGAVLVMTLDLRKVWQLNTLREELAKQEEGGPSLAGRSGARPPEDTTHLVLGYSMVNGAALARGAYGAGAVDGELQKRCGSAQVHFARNALDGTNGCFNVAAWNALAPSLPALKQRIYFGGFNDDLTAPVSKVDVWIGTLLGVIPSQDPYPKPLKLWERAAQVNLEAAHIPATTQCLAELTSGGGSTPLLHVYDFASFDLGHPRRFGRENWVETRKATVEKAGGRFVDMRALMPAESPVFFNDVSHLSEVGYRALARGLCSALPGAQTAQGD